MGNWWSPAKELLVQSSRRPVRGSLPISPGATSGDRPVYDVPPTRLRTLCRGRYSLHGALQQVKVVIHQLNTPLWEINGTEKLMCRELHIAYRYGDHYDSVRRVGDNSESRGQLRIQGRRHAGACPSYHRAGGGVHPEPVASQSQGTSKQTTIRTHIHTYGQFKVFNQPSMHVFGMWEESGVPAENPRRHRENMQTPHRRSQDLNPGPQNWEADALTSLPPCRGNRTLLSKRTWGSGVKFRGISNAESIIFTGELKLTSELFNLIVLFLHNLLCS
ncbi:OTU domain-containing protein 3 isoform X2 [Phycodurus eques]|uniref:OTU domain-containing protein 3 isoform X2 n=1 Tax=Phycodurus eques TaxID=693459 RepID=UPI002ACE6ABB|nr:OTU domain-containing protein 3 isoform X2 [Phycodurus eques]